VFDTSVWDRKDTQPIENLKKICATYVQSFLSGSGISANCGGPANTQLHIKNGHQNK